ncbi:unnamed protein product [Diamesa tonsa]
MIQDLLEPEYYCSSYQIRDAEGAVRVQNGKFSDAYAMKEGETLINDDKPSLAERQTLIVVEAPGTNSWVKHINVNNSNKRKQIPGIEPIANKRPATNCGSSSGLTPNFNNSYVIKVYENFDFFPINTMVEVIGFLSTNIPAPSIMESDNPMETESDLLDFPTMQIHAIHIKELNHLNPLVMTPSTEEPENMYQDVIRMFTQFLFGDEVAAHFLLAHLISSVYARVGMEVLGKFTLNISKIPKEVSSFYTTNLYELLETILPNSINFPMTVENFNTVKFVPKKDYQTNRLQYGMLQLPQHTQLVFDETKMETGKFEAPGVEAVQNITELIISQQLNYDFAFYKLPFNTNIPILILSEGKSLLPCDFSCPLKIEDPDSVKLIKETIAAGMHFLKPKLNSVRKYLTQCRQRNFEINEQESKIIENDFVSMREQFNFFQVENLHSLLVLSRLVGMMEGKSTLDKETWIKAKELEIKRMERVEKKTQNEC